MVTARPLNKRTTTILIAVILALGTGLLMYNYLTSISHVAATVPMRTVVVATRDIPARTSITAGMVTTQDRRSDSVDPDAAPSVGAVAGQIALISIPSGGIVSASKIAQLQLGGLPVRLPAGQRAISIPIDHVKGVADLISAGDHVDVLAMSPARASGAPHATTILRNKVVLAMGANLQVPGNAPPAADAAATATATASIDTVTLAVTPSEAKTLALADLNATLRLDLRSIKDSNRKETGDPFLLEGVAPAPAAPAAARAPAIAAPARPVKTVPRTGILVIDGDQIVGR